MSQSNKKGRVPGPAVRGRLLAAVTLGVPAAMLSPPALAYVGPGAGLGVLIAMLAILSALLATILGLILWPIRMIQRRRKHLKHSANEQP